MQIDQLRITLEYFLAFFLSLKHHFSAILNQGYFYCISFSKFVNPNFYSKNRLWIGWNWYNQGHSQPTILSWQDFFFPQSNFYHFFLFPQTFLIFFFHFSPPGGRLAHPGRPWLSLWLQSQNHITINDLLLFS